MPMKRILVINPNSSLKMTKDIKDTLSCIRSDVTVEVIRMPNAPNVLESFTDYTLAGAQMIEYCRQNDMTVYDGILLACFGDPCLSALKEMMPVPVIGIAEAAFSRALLLGYKFSVIAASNKALPMMESLIDNYDLQTRNAGTVTIGMAIEEFLEEESELEKNLIKMIEQTKEKKAEVVIYGCAGMTMIPKNRIQEKTGITVLDPIQSGISTLLAIIEDKDSISKAGLYTK